jgi:hypothetical protein
MTVVASKNLTKILLFTPSTHHFHLYYLPTILTTYMDPKQSAKNSSALSPSL